MSFALPIAFALSALALPIVIFYILKVRLRRVPVSTNLFWKQIYDEKPPRSIWQYLRHLLSLLAQLLFLTLLVFAVSDPYFSWQLWQGRRIVAVIDNSASMRATDVEPSRFEAAIDSALATAEGLRFRDRMAIVLAGPEPEVVVGMSGHVPTLKRALESIDVTDNPTQLASAIELGHQLLGDHPHAEVVVFTDGCAETLRSPAEPVSTPQTPPPADAQNSPPVPHPASLKTFGTPDAGNIGITQLQVRRSLIDPLGYEVLVAVRNASSYAVEGRVEIELDDIPVDVLPLDLEPDGVFNRSLEKTSLEGGRLVARLTEIREAESDEASDESPDSGGSSDAGAGPVVNALATDDQAWAVLPPRTIQNVLIVTPGNLFLQKVFEANPLVNVTVRKDFPDAWPTGGIIVLHREVPEELPSGSVFVVDPVGGCDAWQPGDPIENPIITEQDKDSPLMTHVRLDNVLMPEAKQLAFDQPPRTLAGSLAGYPVYAEVKRTRGKCLVLSVNINEGDLAFRTAFPIMVTNALGWFAGQTGELRQSLATGAMTNVDIAEADDNAIGEFLLRSPSGQTTRLPLHRHATAASAEVDREAVTHPVQQSAWVSSPPLSECGLWNIVPASSDESAEPIAQLAVNLASDSESDLRTPEELIKDEPDTLAAGWFTRPVWFYLVVAACLLTIAEWWLYQRRVIT